MGKGGYTKQEQPAEGAPIARIGGIRVGANPFHFVEGDALTSREHPDNASKYMGDNPSMPVDVPFANGKDVRKR